jgi:hypothetical protein
LCPRGTAAFWGEESCAWYCRPVKP